MTTPGQHAHLPPAGPIPGHLPGPLPGPADPAALLLNWPEDRPLLMLHSGRPHPRWARWTIIAEPARWLVIPDAEIDARPEAVLAELRAALAPLDEDHDHEAPHDDDALPFTGGWIGVLSHELGRLFEPRAHQPADLPHLPNPRTSASPASDTPDTSNASPFPAIALGWCEAAVLFDHLHQRWYGIGPCDALAQRLQHAAQHTPPARSAVVSPLIGAFEPKAYRDRVTHLLELIAAGDIFQANFTQPFTARFDGSGRALAHAAFTASPAWYGAYLELPDEDGLRRSVISISPELFLDLSAPPRTLTTRPIKGTRPASESAETLRDSAKDAAELHMIVDLMRNDLGRICRYGSVRVIEPRAIESHPTVHHGVSEIQGELRDEVDLVDMLAATFPGGSVTGAPKIRAMQILRALECGPRGPYCGAIGFFDRRGRARLNIAIRTMTLIGRVPPGSPRDAVEGTLTYGAGGGIVADSDPHAEYAECLTKTEAIRRALDTLHEPSSVNSAGTNSPGINSPGMNSTSTDFPIPR